MPRVFADFNNASCEGLRLNCRGTQADLLRQNLELEENLALTLYMEDIEADGIAHYSMDESIWVAKIDWNAIRKIEKRDG